MNPTTALVIIATLAIVRPFIEIPAGMAKGRALVAAGYTSDTTSSCLYGIILIVGLPLWWWYAIATDQILLGIIPTIGVCATILAISVERAATKSAAR